VSRGKRLVRELAFFVPWIKQAFHLLLCLTSLVFVSSASRLAGAARWLRAGVLVSGRSGNRKWQ
jgi:hypothetical protein